MERIKGQQLPVVREQKQTWDRDGQLEGHPISDEVSHQRQEGGSNSEWELGQDSERGSEFRSANFSH